MLFKDVFLLCCVGKPVPEVTWYRDGKVLQPSPRHTIMSDTEGNASLVISEALPGDDAEYLCKAVNKFGVVSCRADVLVDEGKKNKIHDLVV